MNRTLLCSSLLVSLCCTPTFAADSAAAAVPAAHADVHAHAAAKATESADSARAELAELRTQMQALSRRMADLSLELGDAGPHAYAFRYLGDPDRAMIGVVLSPDAHGARISAVTPGAAAAREGLHDGDLIVAIDGKTLDTKSSEAALDDARDRLAGLKENQKVRIEYRRGNHSHDVTLTAERRKAWNWAQFMDGDFMHGDFMKGDFGKGDPAHPLLPKDFDQRIQAAVARATAEATRAVNENAEVRAEVERAQHIASAVDARAARKAADQARRAMRLAMPWWGLNLAPVDSGLGSYFGADHGALVISADEDSLPGIKSGDVITRIAGESVQRPEDALRALRDQPAGSKVKVEVLRHHKTLALNMAVPAYKSIFNLPPLPPAPPVEPTPPSPPAPEPVAPPHAPVAPPTPAPPPPVTRSTNGAAHATGVVAASAGDRSGPADN